MKKNQEHLLMKKISELLKNDSNDDGTFYSSLYELYVLIGIAKGVKDITQGNGTPIKELIQEREALYEGYSRKFG